MSNKVRNVTKQLLGAEDVAFGRGIVQQNRGGTLVPVHKLDLDLPVADESELALTDTSKYPKASIGSRLFVAVNGQYQELSHIVPVIYRVGGALSAEYPYCENGNVIAKWTGEFPKTLTTADADFSPLGWQIYTVGSGRTIVSETQPPISYGAQGLRWYNPTLPATFVYYDDGTSGQWVEESSESTDGGIREDLKLLNSTVQIAGVQARHVAEWSRHTYLPDFFGAVAGEPDSTAKLQAAIDAMPPFSVLHGGGREYNVRSLLLPSNIELYDIKFKTIAGGIDFVSPITILGETTDIWIDGVLRGDYLKGPKTNIRLTRVGINGNRQNQSEINASREDGGRHGIRVLGRVSNLSIDECSVEFCGTDGIEIFSNNSLATTENIDDLCFSNVTIRNSRFNSNRRHGITGDSMFNTKLIGVDCKRNGLDLNTGFPLNHGNRGARFAGNLYGRPFDFEGYGIGSRIVHLEVIGGDFTGNVAGALFYDFADVNHPNFQPRKDITITGAVFDATIPPPSGQLDASITFYSTTATATKQGYENVNVMNCTLKTWINVDGVQDFNMMGGSAKAKYASDTFFARVNNSRKWFFRGVNTDKPAIVATPALPFTPIWANVIGAPVFTSQEFSLAGFTSNGWLCRYVGVYTTPTTGPYFGSVSVAGCKPIPQAACGTVQASGALFPVCQTTNGNAISVPYTVSTTSTQTIELFFEVIPLS